MPSGAKKRKAAKKKKEQEAAQHHHHHHHHHHPHSVDVHSPHGDDDQKHHDDDKDSDAEEVSSPASQEHPNNDHQDEVEKTEDGTNIQASSEENESSGALKGNNEAIQTEMEERVIEIENEQELEPADVESNSKSTILEDSEPQKETNGGVLLQSLDKEIIAQNKIDSQPSNDEGISKNQIVDHLEPKEQGNDGTSLQHLDMERVVQTETESKPDSDELNNKTAIVENVEPQKEGMEGRSAVQTEIDSKPASDELNKQNAIMQDVEPQKKANDGDVLHSPDQVGVAQIEADLKTMDGSEGKNVTVEPAVPPKESADGVFLQSQKEESQLVDEKIVLADNGKLVNSIQEVNSLSEGLTQLTNSSEVGDHHSSSWETKSAEEIDKIKLSDEKIYGHTSVSPDNSREMKENGGKDAFLPERNGRMPSTWGDLGPKTGGNEDIVKKDEIVATSDAKISAACEIGEKLTVSRTVPGAEIANGADPSNSTNYIEHLKYPEVPKSSDCQAPLLTSAPRAVQRTSWMNCCGLLEAFSGSNR